MSEHLSFSCVFAEKKERAEKDERWNESRVSCEPEPTNPKKQKQKKTFSPNATDREYIENRNVKNEMKMFSQSQKEKKSDAIELTYSELIVVGLVFAVSVLSQFSVQFASSSFWHHFSIIFFISHFTFHSLRRMWMVIVSSCCLTLIAYNILHDSLSSRLSGWIQVEVFHVMPTHRHRCSSFFAIHTQRVQSEKKHSWHKKQKNLWNYSQCELLKEGLKGAWVGTNKWSYDEIWQRRTEKTRHVWESKWKKITSQIENSL